MVSPILSGPALQRGLKHEMYRCFLLERTPRAEAFAVTSFTYTLPGDHHELALIRNVSGVISTRYFEDASVDLHAAWNGGAYFTICEDSNEFVLPFVFDEALPSRISTSPFFDRMRSCVDEYFDARSRLSSYARIPAPRDLRSARDEIFGSLSEHLGSMFSEESFAPRRLHLYRRRPSHLFRTRAI